LQYPRFLIAADVSRDGTSLRPVFIGSLDSIVSPLWDGPIWAVPDHTDLHHGAFLFTVEGEFAGLASARDGRLTIVPAAVVNATATRVMQQGGRPPGWIGVEVQAITSQLAAAIGGSTGAVVAWVDPQGPAAGLLAPTDVIEQIESTPLLTIEYWERRLGGLAAGDTLVLTVRRGANRREVRLIAGRPPDPPARWPLGLALRSVAGRGAEVLRVDPESAASRAGLQAGDVITIAGGVEAPTAAQVTRLFAESPDTAPVLIVVARGDAHHVTVLEKKR
jgi:S1-C subfamily serine protease